MAKAEEELKAELTVEHVRDLNLIVRPLRRRARLVYLPAYNIEYTFGEVFDSAGKRQPRQFQAMVGGIGAQRAGVQI